MSTLTRVVIGASTLGGVAGGGYLLHRQLSTDNIEKKLTTNKYQILEDSSKEWESILTSYQAIVSEDSNKHLKFNDFNGGSGQSDTLKEKCKETLKKPSSSKEDYERAKHWCTSPRTLDSALKEQGFKTLSTDTENDEMDKTEWDKKLDEHIKDTQDIQNKKFSVPEIPVKAPSKKDKDTRAAIKKQCASLFAKKHYEKGFESNLEKAKLWCAIKEKE
ncbi:hypothetical protein A6V39_00095 [Candidatus Mycoplasma haematobovis]|uniref:Uncharacterized protein n=1 Tax=Candidatus Mycoplasma haematobovis TaxID=432608 RepID=A0A1A9QFG0_9MOLU|nr:hypothetical protein [Candidatus Mycoplasma haematobovis]OAL10449.1 hypothetical protein A6V39_00095 [Candidatus Mycoplasma haematobovis]